MAFQLLYLWEAQMFEPNAKRELAFAYGEGVAAINNGQVSVAFGGQFQPGRVFTITAYVDCPIDGQSLALQLPKGIELVHGQATQIVPIADEKRPSVVVWRCRLRRWARTPPGIHSNHGVTRTWAVTSLASRRPTEAQYIRSKVRGHLQRRRMDQLAWKGSIIRLRVVVCGNVAGTTGMPPVQNRWRSQKQMPGTATASPTGRRRRPCVHGRSVSCLFGPSKVDRPNVERRLKNGFPAVKSLSSMESVDQH